MTALQLAPVVVGTAAYALFLTCGESRLFLTCGESRLFAAGMALAAAFLTVHLMLT